MSLIHFAARSGARGIGNDEAAAQLVEELIQIGADPVQRCKWAHLMPIHYAAQFGCPAVIGILAAHNGNVNGLAIEFNHSSALHLAQQQQHVAAVEILLSYGCNPHHKNGEGRTPLDCAEYSLTMQAQDRLFSEPDVLDIIDLLRTAMDSTSPDQFPPAISGELVPKVLGMWHDVHGVFFGGSLIEIRPNRTLGVNVNGNWENGSATELPGDVLQLNVSRTQANFRLTDGKLLERPAPGATGAVACLVKLNENVTDDEVTEDQGKDEELEDDVNGTDVPPPLPDPVKIHVEEDWALIEVGDRVLINNKKIGIVRYKGETEFKPGEILYGIQCINPEGKHNGTIGTRTYFRCRPKHGIFAPRRKLKLLPPETTVVKSKRTPLPAPERQPRVVTDFRLHDRSVARAPAPFSSSTIKIEQGTSHSHHRGFAGAPETYQGHQRRMDKLSPSQRASPNLGPRVGSSDSIYSSRRSLNTPTSDDSSSTRKKSNKKQISREVALDFGKGERVMVAKEMGKVMYIGACHLGDGTWIGIELSGPGAAEKGEHSGTVDGQKYFSCKPGQGLLVPANKASWHGNNVARVIAAQRK